MIREQLKGIEPGPLRLMVSLACVVIVAAVLLYVIKPQFQSFSENRASYEMLLNQIDDSSQLEQSIDASRKQIQDLSRQLHGEAGDMPVNEIEAYLVGRLQTLAWESDIELVGVRPGLARRIMEFEEISFEVDIKGEYNQLYDWLNRIGDVLGFMLVTNYDITLSNSNNRKSELNMHMTIVFYRSADR